MEILSELFKQHRTALLILMAMAAVATWLVNNVITALVQNLPAPTATSTEKYKYWFKVANTIIGNLARAKNTSIENSPNFWPAVERVFALHGIPLPPALQLPAAPPQVSDAPPSA